MMKKVHRKILRYTSILKRFTDRYWYPPLIAILSALDNILIVIPTEGILVSSIILRPKRWFILALSVAIGSTIGAIMLSLFIENYGMDFILQLSPTFNLSTTWINTQKFFNQYGLILVFFISLTPFPQQPIIIIASMAQAPLMQLALLIFLGRFLKFATYAYITSHFPKLLKKIWGMKKDIYF